MLDTLVRAGRPPEAGLWGGIAYSLAAFDQVLGPGWTIVPLVVVGVDLAGPGRRCLRRLAPSADLSRIRVADAPNNRVELRCSVSGDRTERLTGGVPGWAAREVAPLLPTLDALYVNFVSGAELDLVGARLVRDDFHGPAYADLHSLFLGVESGGARRPRPLAEAPEFAACFDVVQMNQDEFALYQAGLDEASAARLAATGRAARTRPHAAGATSPVGEDAIGMRAKLLAVTRGAAGADIFEHATCEAERDASHGPPTRIEPKRKAPLRPQVNAAAVGCGDAWGATFFSGLLAGASAPAAAAHANAIAAANLECIGALDLRAALARCAPALREPPPSGHLRTSDASSTAAHVPRTTKAPSPGRPRGFLAASALAPPESFPACRRRLVEPPASSPGRPQRRMAATSFAQRAAPPPRLSPNAFQSTAKAPAPATGPPAGPRGR